MAQVRSGSGRPASPRGTERADSRAIVFSETILAANLAALEHAQGQRPTVAALSPERTRAVADDNVGVRLELRTPAGTWTALESPVATALPRQLFVIGPALGAVLDTVDRAGASTRVVALEPDPSVAALLLAFRDWTPWIAQGRLCVLTGPDYRGAMNCGRFVDVSVPPTVLVSPALAVHRADEVAAAQAVATRLIAEAEANANARARFAGRYLLQTLTNLPVIAREGDAASLDGLFAGRPAIVVGAGPSLDDNLPTLAALQDRAVVIGVDTALRPLLAGGVRPHLVAGVDPAELNAQHLAGVDGLDDVWLAAEGSLHPSAFGGFAGRTFVFKVSDHDPWPWLRTVGLDRGGLRAWGSVVTSAFDLAQRLGCNPIVFAGLDLSYPVRRPYCANTIYDDTWRAAIATYGCTWEALVDDYFGRLADLRVPDVHGAPVLTTPHLVSFRDWLRQQIAADTSRRVINATGAGIMHGPRVAHASLHEALADAAPLGRQVPDALRAAHAASVSRDHRLRPAVAGLVRHARRPRSAPLLNRWIDFSAGKVTAAQILDALSTALQRSA